MTTLTEQITTALANPVADDTFDVTAELGRVLAGIGMSVGDSGGEVRFLGADPIVPSTLRLGAVAGIGLAAKSVAAAALWRHRGGDGQDITMDLRRAPHRLCPFYDRRWEKLNGFAPGTPNDPNNPLSLSFYRTGDDRWVMPMNIYPGLKQRTLALLRSWDDPSAIAAAIGDWRAADLEQAGAEAGVVMPMLRTTREFLTEAQYRDVLAELPLIEIEKIGDSDPEPLPPNASQPLSGVRALGMGHVVAGAGIGRDLALHGADVLNLWRPTEWENDVTYYSANVGVRSATVDPYDRDGHLLIRRLLGDADIFYANRRGGFLDRIGLTAAEAAQIRPGIIHVNVSLHGETGPWANRVGFDQTAGCVTGTMLLEGGGTKPELPPIKVVNDYVLAWLATTGAIQALMRRAVEGGSYRVHVSLTRVALWILGLGVFDLGYARATAGQGPDHTYLDPEVFTAETACGHYQGVTDQIVLSKTPGHYQPVLVPRGSGEPRWQTDTSEHSADRKDHSRA